MRKLLLVLVFTLVCSSPALALLPTQLELTNCQLGASSYTCGQTATVSCAAATQGNSSVKVQSVVFTVSGIAVNAVLTSGTEYAGTWTGSINTNSKYLTSTLTLDSIRGTTSTGLICFDDTPNEGISDSCYIGWGTQLTASNACTCTWTRQETDCINDTYEVTLTPTDACRSVPVTNTLSCDACAVGFYPDYGACNANVSSSNTGLSGTATVSWLPSDGGYCCSVTGLDSDCQVPLSAPTEACYLDGLLSSGSRDTSTGASYSSDKIIAGYRAPVTYGLDITSLGTLQSLEPLIWDFNGDSINDIVVLTDSRLVMINAQDRTVESSYLLPSTYNIRQPAMVGVTISPAGVKYINPVITSTNTPWIAIPVEDTLNANEPAILYMQYNVSSSAWESRGIYSYSGYNRISGVGCYYDNCYALVRSSSAQTTVTLVGQSGMLNGPLSSFVYASYPSSYGFTPSGNAEITSTVPAVIQKSTYNGGSPTMVFKYKIGHPTNDLLWDIYVKLTSSGAYDSSLDLPGALLTGGPGKTVTLKGPTVYSGGYIYQAVETRLAGVLRLGYTYKEMRAGAVDSYRLLWENNETLSGQEGISPVVATKDNLVEVVLSTQQASTSLVVIPAPVTPVSLPSVYKVYRYADPAGYNYVDASFIIDPLKASFYYSTSGAYVNPEDAIGSGYTYVWKTSISSGVKTNLVTFTTAGGTWGHYYYGMLYDGSDQVMHNYIHYTGTSAPSGYLRAVQDVMYDLSDFSTPLIMFPSNPRTLSGNYFARVPHSVGSYYPGEGVISFAPDDLSGASYTPTSPVTLFTNWYLKTTSGSGVSQALWVQNSGNSYLGSAYQTLCSGSTCLDSSISDYTFRANAPTGSVITVTAMSPTIAYNSTLDVLITSDKIMVGCSDGDCDSITSLNYKVKAFNFDWNNPKYIDSRAQRVNINLNAGSWVNATVTSTALICDPDGAGSSSWIPLWYHSDQYVLGLNTQGPVDSSVSEANMKPDTNIVTASIGFATVNRQRHYFSYCDVSGVTAVVTNSSQYIHGVELADYTDSLSGKSFGPISAQVIDLGYDYDGVGEHILAIGVELFPSGAANEVILYDLDETRNIAVTPTGGGASGPVTTLYGIASGTSIVNTISKSFAPAPLSIGVGQMNGTVDLDVAVPGGWFDLSGNKFTTGTVGVTTTNNQLIKAVGLDSNTNIDILSIVPATNTLYFQVATPLPQAVTLGANLAFNALQCTLTSNNAGVQVSIAATVTDPTKTTLSIDPGDSGGGYITYGKLSAGTVYSLNYQKSGTYTIQAKLTDDTNPSNFATATCNVEIVVPEEQETVCSIGSDGLFEYTDSVTNHGWTVDAPFSLPSSSLRPVGGRFTVNPSFSATYDLASCNYQILNVEAALVQTERFQSISVLDETGAITATVRLDAQTKNVLDENSNIVGTWPADGSDVLVQIKVDQFNGIIYKYVNGVAVASTDKRLIPAKIKIESGGRWDYVITTGEGSTIRTSYGDGALLCGSVALLQQCNNTQMQEYTDINLRRGYPTIGEYCGSVDTDKKICKGTPAGQCDMNELQKIINYNPECTKETFNYCVSVLESINSGRAPGTEGDVRGATSCTVLLTAGASLGGVVGPTAVGLWNYVLTNPLLLALIVVVVLISIAIAAVRKRV